MESMETAIRTKLLADLAPSHLEVINESHMHNVPANSQTHFKVVAVSECFEGLRLVARHQRVYGVLSAELAGEVHALALHLYTPSEWLAKAGAPASPNCMGGGA